MNGCEQQWTLVVVVWLGVLTLFTVNGHPFVKRNTGLGINDDPVENHPLSLSERDTEEKPSDVTTQSENDSETTSTALPISPNIATTVGGNAIAVNATVTENAILSQVSANKTNLTTAASQLENVTIIAATTAQAGNLALTSILRSSVNIEINPSQTIQNVPENSWINTATYTSSLKPLTKTPTENSLSAKLSVHISAPASLSLSKSASINIKVPVNASSAVVAGLSSPVMNSANLHSSVTANNSSVAPTGDDQASTPSSQGPSTAHTSSAQQSSQGPSDVPSTSTQITSVALSTNSPSGVPINNKQSELPSSYTATNVPSTGSQSTPNPEVSNNANTKPLIETSPKLPSTGIPSTGVLLTGVASTVPSTGPESLPPTTAPVQKDTGKPTTLANEEPSTKDSVAASTTMGSSTAIPKEPTTNAVPETTKEATTNAVPVKTKEVTTNAVPETTKEVTTNGMPETTKEVATNAMLETTTKATSAVLETTKEVTTNAVPETTKEVTTNGMPETTKAATTNVVPEITKEATTKEKTAAVETKTKNQDNDEGHMTPPDQGREAVLWDFIVPVAIGTGVALAIALGVVFVRTCRRRKLVKVRFGGKPSHPRLLNNDLINLLAESDDEEE